MFFAGLLLLVLMRAAGYFLFSSRWWMVCIYAVSVHSCATDEK
jgi:hypothetical protein